MSRHRGAKHRRRCELLGGISLLSQRTFYPLSDGPSIQNHRITMTSFAPARLVGLAVKQPFAIALSSRFPTVIQVTFVLLRYSLGGDRPSQTAYHVLSPVLLYLG